MTCSCLRGVSKWFTPLPCSAGSPELSESCLDVASKLFSYLHIYGRLSRLPRTDGPQCMRGSQQVLGLLVVRQESTTRDRIEVQRHAAGTRYTVQD